jgi:alpha-N-acetylglucosamine transferase
MINLTAAFPPPADFFRSDGSARYAYITFVMRSDFYIPGALVFAHALRKQQTKADLVCLVTNAVSAAAREALDLLFDRVVETPEIYIPHPRRQERQDRPFLFTRFNALHCGKDGDLGMGYDKIVLADADILPLRCFDHLFTLDTPAGILNERKENCVKWTRDGRYVIPESVKREGKWNWHEIYGPVCPHGARIPQRITDRVRSDPGNLGVNGSVLVLPPSMSEFERMLQCAQESAVADYNWPEMQVATSHWSGLWHNIDLRFSGFNGYPILDALCGTHFCGYKPWNFREPGTIRRFSRFPDYRLWHRSFVEMTSERPRLLDYPKLLRLRGEIEKLFLNDTRRRQTRQTYKEISTV